MRPEPLLRWSRRTDCERFDVPEDTGKTMALLGQLAAGGATAMKDLQVAAAGRDPAVDVSPSQADIDRLVAALCDAELGYAVDGEDLPYSTACWFLETAAELRRSCAYAAVRLMEQLADAGDAGIKVRVVLALSAYIDVFPDRVEAILLALVDDPAQEVIASVVRTLGDLLGRVEEPEFLATRWGEHSTPARKAFRRARGLIAYEGGGSAPR